MVDYKPEDDKTATFKGFNNVYDSVKENLLRTVDEMAKAQPQYYQSISNLQLEPYRLQKILFRRHYHLKNSYSGTTGLFLLRPLMQNNS